jgi:hypothetical protein
VFQTTTVREGARLNELVFCLDSGPYLVGSATKVIAARHRSRLRPWEKPSDDDIKHASYLSYGYRSEPSEKDESNLKTLSPSPCAMMIPKVAITAK